MLCYRDMTFCPYLECDDKECYRRLTKEVGAAAIKAGLLISQFAEKPECFMEDKNNESNT